MARITLVLDDIRSQQLDTVAQANGYVSAVEFAAAKANELIDKAWTAYLADLVARAQSGQQLSISEKTLVLSKLGLT